MAINNKMYTYNTLAKPTENLLTKGYADKCTATFNIKTRKDGISFQGRASSCSATSKTGNAFILSKFALQHQNFMWKVKRSSGGVGVFELNYVPLDLMDNLRFKGRGEIANIGQKFRPLFSADLAYSKSFMNADIKIAENPMTLASSLTLWNKSVGIGGNLGFEIATQSFCSMGLAAWWTKNDTELVVKYEAQNLNVYAYKSISDRLKVGGIAQSDSQGKEVKFEAGGSYQYNNDLLLKAKGNTEGNLAFSAEKTIDDNLKVVTTAHGKVYQADLVKFNFGFRINANYEHK